MTNTKTMDLLDQPFKAGTTRDIKNKVSDNLLDKVSTSRILWHLVKRYKFGLVAMWAIVITIAWAFPPFFDVISSIFKQG